MASRSAAMRARWALRSLSRTAQLPCRTASTGSALSASTSRGGPIALTHVQGSWWRRVGDERQELVAAVGAAAALVASGLSSTDRLSRSDAGPEADEARGVPVSNAHTAQWRIYTDKGAALVAEGKLKEGEAFMRRALEEARLGFGDDTPHVAAALSNLAECLRLQGNLKEAEPMCEKAVAILEGAFGLRDPRVANAYQNLVTFYVLGGDMPKAQATAEKALQIFHHALGRNHPIVARSMWGLASLLSKQGKQKDALALRLESVELMESSGELFLKSSLWRILQVLNELAVAGRHREADMLLARYRKGMEDQFSPESREIGMLTSIRARLCQMMGNLEEAEKQHAAALGIFRQGLSQRGRSAPVRKREQLHALCVETLMCMTELQREMGTTASLARAKSSAEEAVSLARAMWREGVGSQSGFSIGSWSFSWGPSKPVPGKQKGDGERFGAYHLAASLRMLAELRMADGAVEAAGELLLEAYLVITTTAVLKQEARREAREFTWPPSDMPIPVSAPQPDSSQYESLLVLELERCLAAIRPLVARLKLQADPPASAELLRNLRDLLQLEDNHP